MKTPGRWRDPIEVMSVDNKQQDARKGKEPE
jgi:hypothetical protein